jgi:single-strand DNA-binding protein
MAYEATGILIVDKGTQQVSEKFRKREFVLEIQDGQYPQLVKFELAQDKCDLLNGFQLQTPITVTFDLRGRGYDKNGETLYFTSLAAWKVQSAVGGGQQPQGGGYAQPAAQPQAAAYASANQNPAIQRQAAPAPVRSDADNDLPF